MKRIITLALTILSVMALLTAYQKENIQAITTVPAEISAAIEDTHHKNEPIELLSAPIRVEVMVVRLKSGENEMETVESVEEVTFTSVQLALNEITVVYEKPEPLDRFDCIYVNVAQFAGAPYVEADRDRPVCAIMKDGTQINFYQYMGGKDKSILTPENPLVLEDVDYLQFYDGTPLYVPEA